MNKIKLLWSGDIVLVIAAVWYFNQVLLLVFSYEYNLPLNRCESSNTRCRGRRWTGTKTCQSWIWYLEWYRQVWFTFDITTDKIQIRNESTTFISNGILLERENGYNLIWLNKPMTGTKISNLDFWLTAQLLAWRTFRLNRKSIHPLQSSEYGRDGRLTTSAVSHSNIISCHNCSDKEAFFSLLL